MGLPKLLEFTVRGTRVSAPNVTATTPIAVDILTQNQREPEGGAIEKGN